MGVKTEEPANVARRRTAAGALGARLSMAGLITILYGFGGFALARRVRSATTRSCGTCAPVS